MAVPKYKTTEDVEILGVALIAISENRNVTQFKDLVEEYGFHEIDPNRWYSFQWELDFMYALSKRMNKSENMVAIGINIFDNLVLADHIKTIEDGIHMLNDLVHANMRNVPTNYEYGIERIDDKRLRVTDNTPFPHDLVYGYLHGLCKNLLKGEGKFRIKREYINPHRPDSSGAYYDIAWE